MNATYNDPKDPNFPFTGYEVLFRNDSGWQFRNLYKPTSECLAWDKPPEGTNYAIGTRMGFGYVTLDKTGRRVRRIPGMSNYLGVFVRMVSHSYSESMGWVASEVEAWIRVFDWNEDVKQILA